MAVTVSEARQTLGSEADLSDDDIQQMLVTLYALADDLLDLQERGGLQ